MENDMHIRDGRRTSLLVIVTITTAFAMIVMSTSPGMTIISASEQQTEDEESQEDANNVLIVPGAPSLADKAFSPNPINVNVGDDVTWTNNDIQVHTVTSGNGPTDPSLGQNFDSGLTTLQPGQIFSHTFDSAGQFSYFCQIHPVMIGQIAVITSQADESTASDNAEEEEEEEEESSGY